MIFEKDSTHTIQAKLLQSMVVQRINTQFMERVRVLSVYMVVST